MAVRRTAARSSSSGSLGPGKARIVSKTTVKVNLKGVTAKARKAYRVPEGDYLAVVASAEAKSFKTGNPGVAWQFTIDDGQYKGVGPFFYNTMLIEESIWSFRGVLQALEPKMKIPDSMMDVDLKKTIGRHVGIRLVDGEFEGKVRSEIDDVFHPDLLQTEEEEDAVEEEEDETDKEDETSDEPEEAEEEEEEGINEGLSEEDLLDPEVTSIKELRRIATEDFELDVEGLKRKEIVEAIMEASSSEDEEEEIELEEDDEEEEDLTPKRRKK